MTDFIRTDTKIISISEIEKVNYDQIEDGIIEVYCKYDERPLIIKGNHALEAIMTLNPGAIEGKRLKWVKHAWAIHNLIGHPLMQVLSWCGCYKLAIKVHDITIPRPTGFRDKPL